MSDLYKERSSSQVQNLFGKIAKRYDLANGILSLKLHSLWNQKLAASLKGPTLLDLCAGTGEIAYRFLNLHTSPQHALLLDFCPEMLAIAQSKQGRYKEKGHSLDFIQADAAKIPLPDASVDSVSIAYGIRNVVDQESCLSEVYRVLKPGGTFAILELTEPKSKLLQKLHRFYLNTILPKLGGLITQEKEAYQYLSTSIQACIKPEAIQHKLEMAGFRSTTLTPLSFGISTLILSKK